jgi:hypothetical protein
MATPTPTPIIDSSSHIITVLKTGQAQQNIATQIDVRKVTQWTYEWDSSTASWIVKLSIPGELVPARVPDAGIAGTGWNLTKTASLAAGG